MDDAGDDDDDDEDADDDDDAAGVVVVVVVVDDADADEEWWQMIHDDEWLQLMDDERWWGRWRWRYHSEFWRRFGTVLTYRSASNSFGLGSNHPWLGAWLQAARIR